MNSIEKLNDRYVEIKKVADELHLYEDRILSEQNTSRDIPVEKLVKSTGYLQNLTNEIDCRQYLQIMDILEICKQCITCIDAIKNYKNTLLGTTCKQRDVLQAQALVVTAQNNYDRLKINIMKKYGWNADSVDALNAAFSACIGMTTAQLFKAMDGIKSEAKSILEKEYSVELRMNDRLLSSEALPDKLLVARYPVKTVSMLLLKDIGIIHTYQNVQINLRMQGNIIVQSDYEKMNDEAIDEFIIAYILRIIENFPLGAVNVHLFDQNTSYLYKRLCNSFQSDNAGENTKKTVQIHTDMGDLSTFRDVNCEDIFKKTSVTTPDLYSIYESDTSDPFNLIVIRDGLVDGSGYASSEILDTINALSKPGNIGHKCGLRFLIIDNSSSFERQLTANIKHLIAQIQQNCELKLEYGSGKYASDGKQLEVLHVCGDLDVFVQERSKAIADAMNGKEQNYVSLDEISAKEYGSEVGSVLYIPVGKSGSSTVELPLSCKDDNGTVAGQCIGYMAIGQSGSGKSSFFHSLVLNGCMKYSPKDLQFWLLDFKNGGASSKYSNSGLPHIRIIAENNKIDDALCLFQMVLEEMERRSKAFNRNFSDNIVDYNKIAIEKKLEYFPRIIIAIDEIQEIFREDNASVLQKLISSISTRMRSAGMHFVMVAQNLSDGKSYMLKDAFLPSATGRICFRVGQDIPRDSGFEEDFVQRKQEIAELKTGEAYVSYGKDTIKKVKMAYASPQDMSARYFAAIKEKYPEYAGMKPLVIGSRKRLSINAELQGQQGHYVDILGNVKTHAGFNTAVIGEDVYRMTPLMLQFSQHENSSVLMLGNDKLIASSLCASVAVSLMRQNLKVHLFNGDRTKVQEEYGPVPHAFMYVCQNVGSFNSSIVNHKLNELKDVLKNLYSEYLRRLSLVQQADDEDPEFEPMFLIINDLFGIESFINNDMVEGDNSPAAINQEVSAGGFDFLHFDENDLFSSKAANTSLVTGQFRENIQNILSTLVKSGWRYNMHMILAIKGDPSTWRNARIVSEVNNILMYNTTEYADQVENSYYLKEMLKNISNDGEGETMAVWASRKNFSKVRPIIYKLSNEEEMDSLSALVKGE